MPVTLKNRSSTVYWLITLAIYCLTLCLLIGNGSDAAIGIKMQHVNVYSWLSLSCTDIKKTKIKTSVNHSKVTNLRDVIHIYLFWFSAHSSLLISLTWFLIPVTCTTKETTYFMECSWQFQWFMYNTHMDSDWCYVSSSLVNIVTIAPYLVHLHHVCNCFYMGQYHSSWQMNINRWNHPKCVAYIPHRITWSQQVLWP